ncbi:hypothetical protein [Ralstonia pickettii]|uniref:hypothetical protein n=1 Tax=Ralstonia pickettii TaxID=329 RepID=UPI0015E17EF1
MIEVVVVDDHDLDHRRVRLLQRRLIGARRRELGVLLTAERHHRVAPLGAQLRKTAIEV